MFETHVPAAGRRLGLIVLGLLIVVLSTSTTHTQAAPAPQAQAAANPYVFATDGALLLQFVKADKTADYEMLVSKLKEALQKSDKPDRKEMAKSWKVYKAQEPGPASGAIYVSVIAPAVKGADYSVATILTEGFPAEAAALYKSYTESLGTPPGNLLHMTMFSDMGQ